MNTDEIRFSLAEREALLSHIDTLNETIEIMRKERETLEKAERLKLANTCRVEKDFVDFVDLFLNHFNISREDFENNNFELIKVKNPRFIFI